MLYILGIITACQIVVAQTLWKLGLEKLHFQFSKQFLLSANMWRVLISPYVIVGICLYLSATLTFFGLLSKYHYAPAQTVVVVASLIFTFISAALIFGEHVKLAHGLGLLCLFAGVWLITRF